MKNQNARILMAIALFSTFLHRITANEVKQASEQEFVDGSVTLKAFAKAGGNVILLSDSVNTKVIPGVNEFIDGAILTPQGRGSVAVDGIRITNSAGAEADGAHTKIYGQTGFTADILNAIIVVEQKGFVRRFKVSDYALLGDESQNPRGGVVQLSAPFLLAGDTTTKITLERPLDEAGTACYLGIEFFGVQAV